MAIEVPPSSSAALCILPRSLPWIRTLRAGRGTVVLEREEPTGLEGRTDGEEP